MHSAFFSKFSIEKLAKDNGPEWGLLCDETGGHGPGILGGSYRGKNSLQHRNEIFTCKLAASDVASFNEIRFLDSIKADVERDLKSSDARVTNEGSSHLSSFYLEYIGGDIYGRIEISVKSVGREYYTVSARIDERDQAP